MNTRRFSARTGLLTGLILITVITMLLASCASPGKQGTVAAATLQPTRVPTPTATPTPVPPVPTLGPIPQHCPVSNSTPHMILQGLAPVIGASPVWATWPPGPSILKGQPDPTLNTYEPPYGWAMLKTIWEVGPNYTHPVTVQGHDLFDHTPLLFQFLDYTPTADGVLDPQHPDHPRSVVGEEWAEWGSVFVIPKAGCYVVDVSWPTGHWSVTFAVGA